MPFDPDDKKFLNNQIKLSIENIINAVIIQVNLKDEMKISESTDFNFGWAIGFVERGFYLYHSAKYGKLPTDDDESHILAEIQKSLGEIRDSCNP